MIRSWSGSPKEGKTETGGVGETEEPPSLKIFSSKDVISECLSSLSLPFRHYSERRATKCPIMMIIINIIIIIIIVNSERFSCFSKSTYR